MRTKNTVGPGAARAYALLIFTAICFGANTTLARLAVGEVSPMVIVALRWLIVVALLVPLNLKTWSDDWRILRAHIGYLLAMGTFGLAAFTGVFFAAAHHTTAINMGIIAGMLPAFVLLGALVIYRTRAQKQQWLGVALTLAGVVVVVSGGDIARLAALQVNDGDLLILLATILYSGYTLGLRRRPPASAMGVFTVLAAIAFLATLPMVAVEASLGAFQAPTLKGWIVVIVAAVFPTLLAQITFLRGVGIIGPGRAGIFINLVPIFAAAIAVLYLGEQFHLFHAIALALVLGGIWLAERGANTPSPAPAAD